MTSSELKSLYEQNGGEHFFSRNTMKFFGDTMRNYGVRSVRVTVRDNGKIDALELYRRHPVKHGISESSFFALDGSHIPGATL